VTTPLRFPGAPAEPAAPQAAADPRAPARGESREPALPIDPQLLMAKRKYAEQFGDVVVTNTYLKLAVATLSLLCLALVFSQIRVAKTIANFKPLVIRIDQIGKAEAIRYDDLTYTPREAEVQYFLAQFVRLYYSRNRQSLAANLRSALVFLEPQLADSIVQAWERQRVVEDYARSNLGDIDIAVRAVSIVSLEKPPYQATVDYEQIYYAPRERTETKRVLYTAHFTFTFHGGVLPTAVLAQNPLGLVIQYFKEDAAIEPTASAGN
jgi:type IV secretory pathway TrbF-like protein